MTKGVEDGMREEWNNEDLRMALSAPVESATDGWQPEMDPTKRQLMSDPCLTDNCAICRQGGWCDCLCHKPVESPTTEYRPRDWDQPHLQALNYLNNCDLDGVPVSIEKLREFLDVKDAKPVESAEMELIPKEGCTYDHSKCPGCQWVNRNHLRDCPVRARYREMQADHIEGKGK